MPDDNSEHTRGNEPLVIEGAAIARELSRRLQAVIDAEDIDAAMAALERYDALRLALYRVGIQVVSLEVRPRPRPS